MYPKVSERQSRPSRNPPKYFEMDGVPTVPLYHLLFYHNPDGDIDVTNMLQHTGGLTSEELQ